jgi:hypothetical protein
MRFFGERIGGSRLVSRGFECCMWYSGREELGEVLWFLAGGGVYFEMLVISVGGNLIFGGLVTCFFPWALLLGADEGPAVNWFSSIEIEPGYRLVWCAGMEQVSKEVVSGVRCSEACAFVEELACLVAWSFNEMWG